MSARTAAARCGSRACCCAVRLADRPGATLHDRRDPDGRIAQSPIRRHGRGALINNKTPVVTSAACQIRRVALPLPATVAPMMLTAPWGQAVGVHCVQHQDVPTVALIPI